MRRDIFPYLDADGKERWADPAALERRLRVCLQADPRQALADLRSPDIGAALEAGQRLAFAVCTAFDLGKPFDPATGDGVLEAVWCAALASWVEWMEKNASGASSCATSSKPTPDGRPPTPAASSAASGITTPA